MAQETPDSPQPIAEIEQGPSKFELFLDRHQRKLTVLVILGIIGLLAYVALTTIQRDNRHSAGAALVAAEDLTAMLDIAKNHACTPAARSASLLAADAEWNDGRQDDAIATLRDFIDNNPGHAARPTAMASLGARLMAQGKAGPDQKVTVGEIMNREPITVEPETPTVEAIRLMRRRKLACLPVTQDGRLVGIITEHDLIVVASHLLESQLDSAR